MDLLDILLEVMDLLVELVLFQLMQWEAVRVEMQAPLVLEVAQVAAAEVITGARILLEEAEPLDKEILAEADMVNIMEAITHLGAVAVEEALEVLEAVEEELLEEQQEQAQSMEDHMVQVELVDLVHQHHLVQQIVAEEVVDTARLEDLVSL